MFLGEVTRLAADIAQLLQMTSYGSETHPQTCNTVNCSRLVCLMSVGGPFLGVPKLTANLSGHLQDLSLSLLVYLDHCK